MASVSEIISMTDSNFITVFQRRIPCIANDFNEEKRWRHRLF